MIYTTQRSSTRNQSTQDFERQSLFTFGNRFQEAVLVNKLGETLQAKNGFLVVRNAGTLEIATVEFGALANLETVILAGLTFTASGAKTGAEVAAAFASLAAGTAGTGALSGTLTGYSTGAVQETDKVAFTATTVGNKTDLAATGTGAVTGITIINGTSGTVDGISPATASNIGDVIGILNIDDIDLADAATANAHYAINGDIDSSLLVLPIGVTLDSIISGKTLKDILTGLGFVINNVIENSKFDN